MAFNIGMNVVEVDGRTVPTIVAAPLSIAGFLVRSQRGVPHLPVHIQGLTDFASNFGVPTVDAFGAHAIRGFFENGGTEAYIVRVTDSSAQAATVELDDRAAVPVPTLLVSAGRRGRLDPGTWANGLTIQVTDHPLAISAIPAQ